VLDGKAIWDSGLNNIIRGCRIFDNQGAGIYVSGSGATISDNYITHNSVGIEFPSGIGTLRNNILLNNGKAFDFDTFPSSSEIIDASNIVDGKPVCFLVNEHDKTVPSEAGYVLLNNCTNITVQDMSVLNSSDSTASNSNGIYLYSTKDSLISRNYLQAGTGINLARSCQNIIITENYVASISLTSSSNISIINNSIQANGILLSTTTDCLLSKNTIKECTTGIRLQNSPKNQILQNHITQCNTGISIFVSNENEFHSNNFIDNMQDVFEQHKTWEWPLDNYYASVNNMWDGNYWSNYTGRDNNADGIGDTPHVIYEDKKDNAPLMSSVDVPEISLTPMNYSSSSSSLNATITSTTLLSWVNFVAVAILIVTVLFLVIGLLVYSKKRKKVVKSAS
jgi:parallel beta-helix repeat protein